MLAYLIERCSLNGSVGELIQRYLIRHSPEWSDHSYGVVPREAAKDSRVTLSPLPVHVYQTIATDLQSTLAFSVRYSRAKHKK